jgi:hypothetical protein
MAVKTVRQANVGSVELKSAEHVHYFLDVSGAQGIFNLSCEHRTLLQETDFPGHPKMHYEWQLKFNDLDADEDNYTVAMSYFVALEYSLRIEHHRADHTRIELLSDKDYEGEGEGDFDAEIIDVFKAS